MPLSIQCCIVSSSRCLGIVHQSSPRLRDYDKSARYDIRSGKHLSEPPSGCEHDDNDTVLCQMLAVTQHDIATSPTLRPSTGEAGVYASCAAVPHRLTQAHVPERTGKFSFGIPSSSVFRLRNQMAVLTRVPESHTSFTRE